MLQFLAGPLATLAGEIIDKPNRLLVGRTRPACSCMLRVNRESDGVAILQKD